LALGKLNLEPGMTLLDIGCGWGATMRRAIERYDVNVVGLTLSENQAEHVQKSFDQMDTTRTRRVLLEGWEKFHEPVDRIVSIGAFEHFGRQRYGRFFKMAYNALPPGGIMLLHTIVRPSFKDARAKGLSLTHEIVEFSKFILAEIFPGGQLPAQEDIFKFGEAAGFSVERVQLLQEHYARTLNIWAANLEANKEKAIAVQSQEVYDKYMHYLTGCENFFRKGISNVGQFTLVK
ncbi:cyclopropane mycolic acid synthase family methyltransferase, partial [Mycobacterium intracellulare]|uniref:cyclopropane mycolic acid synthase family methyltransferase n=1 Tax=Mycobacterium intracellulare TaxID=1767 RepID=UPI00080BAAD8